MSYSPLDGGDSLLQSASQPVKIAGDKTNPDAVCFTFSGGASDWQQIRDQRQAQRQAKRQSGCCGFFRRVGTVLCSRGRPAVQSPPGEPDKPANEASPATCFSTMQQNC